MSISINTESAELGTYGPFALSYNSKKDRLYAKADDVSMYCNPSDAPRHVESFPALAEAFSRLVFNELHSLLCPMDHSHDNEEGEPTIGDGVEDGLQQVFDQMEDDARKSFAQGSPDMPQELRDLLNGLAKSAVTEIRVPKGTPEAYLPGRPASEAPEHMKPMLESLAKDLGIRMEDIRFGGGPTPDSNE